MSMSGKAVIALCGAVGLFLAGAKYGRISQYPKAASGDRKILYYVDPMHPSYKSDRPGIAPDCGMELQPVYVEYTDAQYRRNAAPAGTVRVGSEMQQSVGISTEEAAERSGSYTVRLLGRVALDETRIYRIAAAVDGWVRKAGPIVTGSIVQKDEVLATFYNRDFLTAQQTYLYALNTMDRFKDKENEDQLKLTSAQMQAAEENLEFLGMGKTQLQQVARTRQIAKDIQLRSPVAGLVLARNAFAGLRFDRGGELFRIADLNHVWILADAFENDARLIHAAQSVVVRYEGSRIPVQMSKTLPQFDAGSRSFKVRLEVNNPNFLLRPDMFVDVEFQVSLPPGIDVPVDAVMDSGLRKTVYVEREKGLFEPRLVETRAYVGDRVLITSGLKPGERIVVSGNFLIDSESRLQLGAAGGSPHD